MCVELTICFGILNGCLRQICYFLNTFVAQFTSSGRLAVHATAAENDYVKIIVPKSEEIKRMIYDVISVNVLFRNCCTEELNDLVDVFDVANFESGSTVIRQGEEGEHFYVVEVGILDVSIHKVSSEGEHSDVMIDEPYTLGSSFGELALMYGSPRAATIKAREASKLWSIDRHAFRCITGQHKKRREDEKVEFLKQVKCCRLLTSTLLKKSF